MFGFLKKKKTKGFSLGSPVKGATISLKEVNDPTFREGMLGEGVAIKPTEGKIYAPADGSIGMVFDTLHARPVCRCQWNLRKRSKSGRGYCSHSDKIKNGILTDIFGLK